MLDTATVFLIAFLVSMGLTVAMFLLGIGNIPGIGGVHAHGGAHLHGDLVHSGGAHGAPLVAPSAPHSGAVPHTHAAAEEGASPLNMATLLAFATWFSGTGYVMTGPLGFGLLITVAFATAVGLTGAGIVFFVLVRVLLPGQTPYMRAEDYELEGTVGHLSIAIRAGGTGEIVFSKGGTRRVATARSTDADAIERGAEVVIVRQERGIAYVQPFEEFIEEPSHPAEARPDSDKEG